MKLSITDMFDISNFYPHEVIQSSLDDWFNFNLEVLKLSHNGITTEIDMDETFPDCSRKQAYNHFKYFVLD